MKIVSNELVGQYFCPKDFPTSGPWLITEIKIERRYCDEIKLWIRGNNSMWFRASQCLISEKEELEIWLEEREINRICQNSYKSFVI